MAKIYALAIVNIAELRDSKLASLFGESEEFKGKWDYLWTKNNRLTTDISFQCKVYKTINGAQKASELLTQTRGGRNVHLKKGHYFGGSWVSSFDFDIANFKLMPVDITETWDKEIDAMIQKEKLDYEKRIKKLESKKS